ncbi:MAG TPA: helix-turn-helix transcriptional regulator [Micromonosporaceae bacterium]|nr:helix-turn-helix transcriptional regulator [Micromonosporaceae bacterium]
MAVSTRLMEIPGGGIGRFVCQPDDVLWDIDVYQSRYHLLAFPRSPVWIAFPGRAPVLADLTQVMLHRDGQTYQRSRVTDGHGDDCRWIALSDALARQIAAELDPSAADAPAFTFAMPYARVDIATFFAHRTALRRALALRDAVAAAEACYAIVRTVMATAVAARADDPARAAGAGDRTAATMPLHGRPAPRTSRGRAARGDLVAAARGVIASAVAAGEPVGLEALARRLHTSPYHLTRAFREVTGAPMHRYLTDVRLRAGLDLLLDSDRETPIADLAHRLGFASHAHFTTSFRALFAATPSQVRAAGKPRKILEAAAAPPL